MGLQRMTEDKLKLKPLLIVALASILVMAFGFSFQIIGVNQELAQVKNQTSALQNFTNAQLDLDNKIIAWSQTVETRLAELDNRTSDEQK